MSEKKGLNRRDFIAKSGLAVAGVTLAASGIGILLSGCDQAASGDQAEAPEWPLEWTTVDADKAAEKAYEGYGAGG